MSDEPHRRREAIYLEVQPSIGPDRQNAPLAQQLQAEVRLRQAAQACTEALRNVGAFVDRLRLIPRTELTHKLPFYR